MVEVLIPELNKLLDVTVKSVVVSVDVSTIEELIISVVESNMEELVTSVVTGKILVVEMTDEMVAEVESTIEELAISVVTGKVLVVPEVNASNVVELVTCPLNDDDTVVSMIVDESIVSETVLEDVTNISELEVAPLINDSDVKVAETKELLVTSLDGVSMNEVGSSELVSI